MKRGNAAVSRARGRDRLTGIVTRYDVVGCAGVLGRRRTHEDRRPDGGNVRRAGGLALVGSGDRPRAPGGGARGRGGRYGARHAGRRRTSTRSSRAASSPAPPSETHELEMLAPVSGRDHPAARLRGRGRLLRRAARGERARTARSRPCSTWPAFRTPGSDRLGCSLAMDKEVTKRLLRDAAIPRRTGSPMSQGAGRGRAGLGLPRSS
jgi:hypothetical protein